MQVEFKQDKQLKGDQLIIKANKLTPEIEAALAFLEEKLAQKITVYQGSDEIILPLTSILFLRPVTGTSGLMTGKAATWSSRPCGSWKPACPATLTGLPRVPWSTAGKSMPSSGPLRAASLALPLLTRRSSSPAATTKP